MELSRIEYRRLVEDVAEAVLAKVLPFVKKRRAEKPEEQWTWVSAEEAAKIVGLTKNHPRQDREGESLPRDVSQGDPRRGAHAISDRAAAHTSSAQERDNPHGG